MLCRWVAPVMVLTILGTASAQSLGEVAEKEKARRAKNQERGKKVRTLTADDLRSGGQAGGTFNVMEPATAAPAQANAGQQPGTVFGSAADAPSPQEGGSPAMAQLKSKNEFWRGRYAPVKASADRLEREVRDLEEKASRIGAVIRLHPGWNGLSVPEDPHVKTEAEVIRQRLPRARSELALAKKQLGEIEEAARKDGVASGQLY